jgi:hypothetical protein
MTVLSKKSWQKQPATYLVEWYIWELGTVPWDLTLKEW